MEQSRRQYANEIKTTCLNEHLKAEQFRWSENVIKYEEKIRINK